MAKERHFQKAAHLIHISQPTLSQQIQKLERELGTYLLERSPRRVELTEEGIRFLKYATTVLDTIEKAMADIKNPTNEPAGRISIGVIPTIGPYLLPSVIRTIRKKAPKITLEMHDLTTSALLQHLKDGRIHLGLLALPINERSIAIQSLGHEPIYLAVGDKHALAKHKSVSTNDFRNEQLLVLQEGHCFRDQSLEYCKLASTTSRVIFEGSSLISVMRLAAIGEGVTFVPKMAALSAENPNVRFIPFKSPAPSREIGIAWRMSTPLNRAQTVLIEIIESELKRHLA